MDMAAATNGFRRRHTPLVMAGSQFVKCIACHANKRVAQGQHEGCQTMAEGEHCERVA